MNYLPMRANLFVFDTSVVLQAMMSRRSGAYAALKKADELGMLVVSDATLLELERKIELSKFNKFLSLPARRDFYNAYSLMALNIEPTLTITACRDPKDDMFLSLAITAGADCIITRDEDLLVLHPFQNIPIVTTGAFLNMAF
jgi:uncharacterized protein